MIVIPFNAANLNNSVVRALTNLMVSLPQAGTRLSSEEFWTNVAKTADAKLSWNTRELYFEENNYLLFMIKWC